MCLNVEKNIYKVYANILQAGLVLRQGYVPEKKMRKLKSRKSKAEFPFKTVYFLRFNGSTPHPIQCMTTPLVDIRTCRVYNYILYVHHTCISLQDIYLFLVQ